MLVDTQILGYLLNWGLLGALTVQLYLYYGAFPQDPGFTKFLVYTVYTIVLVQTVLMTHRAFTSFVYGFGDPSALTSLGFEWFSLPILSGLVAFIGQAFYAYRICTLSKSWKMPVFIVTVSLINSIGAFLTGYFARQSGSFSLLNSPGNAISSAVGLGGSALSDIIIAFCLTYSLKLLKSDTGFRGTHALILRLIWITIETGCATAVMALTSLILMFAFPGKVYFFTPAVVLSMLYANNIVAVLNSRSQILNARGCGGPNRSTIVTIEQEVFGAQELDDLGKTKGIGVGFRCSRILVTEVQTAHRHSNLMHESSTQERFTVRVFK
ncbi:hypothetical protein DFH08DRAFT_816026 [Mycena albidolilacea]|uniref:DUF6534 domain-containing protein n=1 Tax=Mycena albidolilacea TaxID=1033008 RepID=A0AAD7EJL5_9AGAR|nr:hypothetical protein DFH08DRAFT_816026 [Mycena albidolilacea]